MTNGVSRHAVTPFSVTSFSGSSLTTFFRACQNKPFFYGKHKACRTKKHCIAACRVLWQVSRIVMLFLQRLRHVCVKNELVLRCQELQRRVAANLFNASLRTPKLQQTHETQIVAMCCLVVVSVLMYEEVVELPRARLIYYLATCYLLLG